MEPPSGFEPGTPGLGNQRLNHLAIAPMLDIICSEYHLSDRVLSLINEYIK